MLKIELLYTCVTLIPFLTIFGRQLDAGPSSFEEILSTSSFVDKTHFIRELLENERFSIITMPPKFGKSTVSNMIKHFLEIEVDSSGLPVTKSNYIEEHVQDTKNYILFTNYSLNINKHLEFFSNYFGRTPVISVKFKPNSDCKIVKLYDAVRVIKWAIHNSFKQHEYLKFSDQLTDDHRRYVQTWCDDHSYKTMIDTLYVSHSLQSLAQYLQKHFRGRKVFLLVDDYDFIIHNALTHSETVDKLNEVVKYFSGILKDILNDNDEYLEGALMTGVAQFPFLNISDIANVTSYHFLGNHNYNKFFGLTKEHVSRLLSIGKVEDKTKTLKHLKNYCNGYKNRKEEKFYNPFSVFKYLKSGRFINQFVESKIPTPDLLKNKEIIDVVQILLEGETPVMISLEMSLDDCIYLYSSHMKPKTEVDSHSVFLNYLLEWGLLSYAPEEDFFLGNVRRNFDAVYCPNQEIKEHFSRLVGNRTI